MYNQAKRNEEFSHELSQQVGAHSTFRSRDGREGSGGRSSWRGGLDRQGSVIYVKGAGLDPRPCRGPWERAAL